MDNAQKQAAFKARMREKGLIQITEWIPAAKRDKFKAYARSLRGTSNRESGTSNRPGFTSNRPAGTSNLPPAGTSNPPSKYRIRYPAEVRLRAVEMRKAGATKVEILDYIEHMTGNRPVQQGFSSQLKAWAEKIERGLA